jgi:hypothetical protein
MAEESHQKMKAAEKAHKDYVAKNLTEFEKVKQADLDRLKQAEDIGKSNVKLRQEALEGKTEALKNEKQAELDKLAAGVKETTSRPGETYGEKRALYNIAGVNALTLGSGVGLGAAIGTLPAAGLAGAGLLGSNLMYSKPAQTWLKNKAIAERPEWMQNAAKAIKENPAIGPLSAIESYQESRKKPGVHVYDPVTGKEIKKSNLP